MSVAEKDLDAALAAGFNDARHNIYLALVDIARRLGREKLADIKNDDQILYLYCGLTGWHYSKDRYSEIDEVNPIERPKILRTYTPEYQAKLQEAFDKAFPFARVLAMQCANKDWKKDSDSAHNETNSENHSATPSLVDYDRCLYTLILQLNNFRNHYSHAGGDGVRMNLGHAKDLLRNVIFLYEDAVRVVSNRFDERVEVDHFSRRNNKLKSNFIFEPQYCMNDKKVPTKFSEITGLPQANDDPATETILHWHVLSPFGLVFYCSLFLNPGQIAQLFSVWLANRGVKLSEDYWLKKSRVARQHDGEQKIAEVVRQILGARRLRLPVVRLDSESSYTSLTLDTLTELVRCPRELFRHLSDDNRERFRVAGVFDTDGEALPPLVRSVHGRFASLTLRHLGQLRGMERVGYAVDLGSYRHNVRIKPGDQFADNIPRVRALSQPLIAYGHIEEFRSHQKPELWLRLEENYAGFDSDAELLKVSDSQEKQLKRQLVKTYPHVHTYKDKIGLRLLGDSADDRGYAQVCRLIPEGVDDAVANHKGHYAIRGEGGLGPLEPDFWLSPAELKSFAFLALLHDAHGSSQSAVGFSPFEVLQSYRIGVLRLYRALASGELAPEQFSGLSVEDKPEALQQAVDGFFQIGRFSLPAGSLKVARLPSVLKRYLLAGDDKEQWLQQARSRLSSMIEDGARRLRWVESTVQNNHPTVKGKTSHRKPGHKKFRAIKAGHFADFLADDMMRFQPVDLSAEGGGKLNSQQYQILQYTLAFFGQYATQGQEPTLAERLKHTGLIGGEQPHPFLEAVVQQKCTDVLNFYKAYLQKREKYLLVQQKLLSDGTSGLRASPHEWNYLRLRQNSTIDTWLDEVYDRDARGLRQPLVLPRGLFSPLIRQWLVELNVGLGQMVDNKNKHRVPSVDESVICYMAGAADAKEGQPFYSWDRHHDVFDLALRQKEIREKKCSKYSKKQLRFLDESKRRAEEDEFKKLKALRAKEFAKAQGVSPERVDDESHNIDVVQRLLVNKRSSKALSQKDQSFLKLARGFQAYQRERRAIAQRAAEDRLLYLLMRRGLNNDVLANLDVQGSTDDLKLNNLSLETLSTKIPFRLAVVDYHGDQRTLFHPSCQIKNLGELRHLGRDRRLPGLLCYFPSDEVLYQRVHKELTTYGLYRQRALAAVRLLEKEIDNHCPQLADPLEKSDAGRTKKNKSHIIELKRLFYVLRPEEMSRTGVLPSDVMLIGKIRNAFCHNQYPHEPEIVDSLITHKFEDTELVCKRLYERLKSQHEFWISQLKEICV